MNITIRRAVKEDCPRLLELITELAVYEKAPNEVTVTLEHFEKVVLGKILCGGLLLRKKMEVILGFAFTIFAIQPGKGNACISKILLLQKKQGKRNWKIIIGSVDRRSKRKKIQRHYLAGTGME